ncbi:unnamed protein product [Ostreobium quekettii]|uniref:Probable magnesium transporter n=1 Tax=Ostreobium quekettii TaxID=121088 RepID=A0A8S1J641_9CHLO|nr:unnamed protein product [Ostreobium quekettii]|eukprot:evm.model.scf_738.4 EVM.evm.TU.scf_738.4   scf_738:35234-41982(+)
MWLMIGFTILASTGSNFAKVLQKKATRSLPRLTMDAASLRQYLNNRDWATGVALDVASALVMAVAAANTPVSILVPIQPVGLVFLAVFSHFYLKEQMQRWQGWCAFTCCIGIMGLGFTAVPSSSEDVDGPRVALTVLLVWAAVAVSSALRQLKRQKMPEDDGPLAQEGMWCGLEAGMFFGLSTVSCRTGFLMSRVSLLFAPLGLAFAAFFTSSGFVLQTKGLKDGNTVMVCTFLSVSSMVSGVLIGLLALDEKLPATRGAQTIQFLSWVCLLGGATVSNTGPEALGRAVERVRKRAIPRWLLGCLPAWVNQMWKEAARKEEPELPVHEPPVEQKPWAQDQGVGSNG